MTDVQTNGNLLHEKGSSERAAANTGTVCVCIYKKVLFTCYSVLKFDITLDKWLHCVMMRRVLNRFSAYAVCRVALKG